MTANKITLVNSINLALHHSMQANSEVILLGQDVGKCGGVFRATEGLLENFGPERVYDTPLAEASIVGVSVGLALQGLKPVAELQFSGFAYQAFHQIEQHVARYHQRSRGLYPMSMVIRMPYGGGVRAFEHHSESRESYYIHTPGLKVVIPSTVADAYGLLCSAIEDPDPVILMEPKKLYRSFKQAMPEENFRIPIGQAKVVQEGEDLTLISYGAMMPLCQQVCQEITQEVDQKFKHPYSIELIDLRTLSPIDHKTLVDSVKKTGRAVVVHEAPKTLGPAAEVSALLMEQAFDYLKAPIGRVSGYDTQMPYFRMENEYLPNAARLRKAIEFCMEY